MAGAETWHRILNAIERLEAKLPAEGGRYRPGAVTWSSSWSCWPISTGPGL